MMDPLILEQVRRIAADVFALSIDQIGPDSSPDTIERWDSLQHVNLMLAIEQGFELEIAPEDMERLASIGDIAMFVDGSLATRGG